MIYCTNLSLAKNGENLQDFYIFIFVLRFQFLKIKFNKTACAVRKLNANCFAFA
jgi:hypothetical protein